MSKSEGRRQRWSGVFKKLWLSVTGISWGLIFVLNAVGILQTAKDVLHNRGKIVIVINTIVAWQWLPLTLFILGVVALICDRLGWIRRKAETAKPGGSITLTKIAEAAAARAPRQVRIEKAQ